MHAQMQTAKHPSLRQLGTAVAAIGGIGTAAAMLWWLCHRAASA
jgi:hypothetical protein